MIPLLKSSNLMILRCASRVHVDSRVRCLSSTTNYTAPSKTEKTSTPTPEQDIISRLTPLKRILCLCPVPLGRGRVAWSGGDSCDGLVQESSNHTIHMNFRMPDMQTQMQPKVTKYRYGERYVIGVAISDAYLTHAEPVSFKRTGLKDYVAEMVPSFRCDTHNFGPAPIFYTNLPYFRNELLRNVGHSDIGGVVIAMPMKPSANPFCPAPTRVQIEQERKLEVVRQNIMGVIQNYVTQHGDDYDDVENDDVTRDGIEGKRNQRLGQLGLQGFTDHRMSLAELLSKSYDSDRGSWGHITRAVRQIQNEHTIGGGSATYFAGNQIHGSHNTFSSIPPEIHAAVALNAMMEKYTSAFHNSFF